MKKIGLYIIITLLLIVATITGTYAYMIATINSSNNAVNTSGTNLKVVYSGGAAIEGILNLSNDKTGGLNTTVNIKIAEDSVVAKAHLYIDIEKITSSIATNALNWEVYKTVNGVESFVNSGTFADCLTGTTARKCVAGDKLYIVNDYQLSTEDTAFTIYVWLDGNKVGNEVVGATFKGIVAAESENFTGDLG